MTVADSAVPQRVTRAPIASAAFLAEYPDYATTSRLDELRATEYAYLARSGHIYFDYTGAGLAALAQYRAGNDRLSETCFGNPHSENPTSSAATELIERARAAVLAHFNAAPTEYTAIFTANATAACRLVGESYPFGPQTPYVLSFDNHNSVNGIREFARVKEAPIEYVPLTAPELRLREDDIRAALRRNVPTGSSASQRRGLFAYPAQSNFSGVQHPLEWVDLAHEHGYDVLLDAAAFVSTNQLDLSVVRADFVPVSWYKMFGHPTGVGCLIVRNEALSRLRRPWFSGGTIHVASVQGDWHAQAVGAAAFEDGTQNFLSIPDVEFGIDWLRGIGMDVIHRRTGYLTEWLLGQLISLRHDNGEPLIEIYGPRNTRGRGATIAFNVLDPAGTHFDERLVGQETAAVGFSIRTGCFCNPGAGEVAFGITRQALLGLRAESDISIDQYRKLLGLPTGGAARVSLGLVSNFPDVQRLVDFVDRTYRNRTATPAGPHPRENC